MAGYFLVALETSREPNYIYNAHLQAELIGASPMWLALKMAKLFTCLGGFSQLGQSIVNVDQYCVISECLCFLKLTLVYKNI